MSFSRFVPINGIQGRASGGSYSSYVVHSTLIAVRSIASYGSSHGPESSSDAGFVHPGFLEQQQPRKRLMTSVNKGTNQKLTRGNITACQPKTT